MKILHTADIHIEKEKDLEILEKIIGIAENKNCDHILIAGDLFENGQSAGIFSPSVARLLAGFSGKVWIIPGNHDENLPEVLKITNGKVFDDIELVPLDEDTDLLAIPYCDGAFTDLLNDNKIPPSEKDVIAMMHGTLYHDDFFFSDMESNEYFPIKFERLQEMEFHYTALGHYHTYFQEVCEHGTIVNPGSPIATKKSDIGRRSVTLFDTETSGLQKLFTQTPYYDIVTIEVNFLMGEEEILAIIHNKIHEYLENQETQVSFLTLILQMKGTVSMDQEEQEKLECHLKDLLSEKGIFSSQINLNLRTIDKKFLDDPIVASILKENGEDKQFQNYAISVLSDIYTNEL